MPPFLHAFHSRLKESPGQSSLNFPKSLANFQRALWKTDENGHQRDLLALKFSVRNFPRNFSTREVTLEKRLRSSTSSEDRRSWRAFFTEISNQVRLNREFDLNYSAIRTSSDLVTHKVCYYFICCQFERKHAYSGIGGLR